MFSFCYSGSMNELPITTLFMLMSVDGKISTGSTDERDFDKDLPNVSGVKDGLAQYYKLEEETDLFSFNTGRVMAKVGWNEEKSDIKHLPVSFIVVDNKPHLTKTGVSNLLQHAEKLYLVTTNIKHPAKEITDANLEVICYEDKIDFCDLLQKLKSLGVDRLTIQSGGEMNAVLARAGLINFVSLVVAPVLVGGKATPTLIDGKSLETVDDLKLLKPLELISADVLEDSYLHLKYKII